MPPGRLGRRAEAAPHTYGLLRAPSVRVVSDDWFFGRIFGDDILAYGSEKNFYIRADLADIWKEFADLVKKAVLDDKGRAGSTWLGDREGAHPAAHDHEERDPAQARCKSERDGAGAGWG